MKKQKAFKPTAPWIKKDMAQAKRRFNTWYSLGLGAKWSPISAVGPAFLPSMKKIVEKSNDLILYAAALGQKRGLLPENLSEWKAVAIYEGDAGTVTFRKTFSTEEAIKIPVRFLTWSPTAPVISTGAELAIAA